MMDIIKRFAKEEEAQTLTEYMLIIALVAIATFAALRAFGVSLRGLIGLATAKVAEAMG